MEEASIKPQLFYLRGLICAEFPAFPGWLVFCSQCRRMAFNYGKRVGPLCCDIYHKEDLLVASERLYCTRGLTEALDGMPGKSGTFPRFMFYACSAFWGARLNRVTSPLSPTARSQFIRGMKEAHSRWQPAICSHAFRCLSRVVFSARRAFDGSHGCNPWMASDTFSESRQGRLMVCRPSNARFTGLWNMGRLSPRACEAVEIPGTRIADIGEEGVGCHRM